MDSQKSLPVTLMVDQITTSSPQIIYFFFFLGKGEERRPKDTTIAVHNAFTHS